MPTMPECGRETFARPPTRGGVWDATGKQNVVLDANDRTGQRQAADFVVTVPQLIALWRPANGDC